MNKTKAVVKFILAAIVGGFVALLVIGICIHYFNGGHASWISVVLWLGCTVFCGYAWAANDIKKATKRGKKTEEAKTSTYTYQSTADKARFDLHFTNQAILNDEAKIKEIKNKIQRLEAERNSKSNEQFETEYRELNSRLSSAMQHLEYNQKIKQEQLEKYNDYI